MTLYCSVCGLPCTYTREIDGKDVCYDCLGIGEVVDERK